MAQIDAKDGLLPQPWVANVAGEDRFTLPSLTMPALNRLTRKSKCDRTTSNTKQAREHQHRTPWTHHLTHFGLLVFFCLWVYALVYTKVALWCMHGCTSVPTRYVFLFGDSYSSTGYNMSHEPRPSLKNPFGNPIYPGERTSGGDIWIDTVVKTLGHTIVYDLAVGANMVNHTQVRPGSLTAGGSVRDFIDQQAEFEVLAQDKGIRWSSRNSVFISWFGINDIAVQIHQGRNFSQSAAILAPDVDQYFALLRRQYQLGARNFIIILVPPIHRAPVYDYGNASNAADIQQLTAWWNSYMQNQHKRFRSGHDLAESLVIDPTPIFNDILDHPEEYGAPNNPCVSYPEGQPCLWADFIHPGIVIQREFGRRMVAAVGKHEQSGLVQVRHSIRR